MKIAEQLNLSLLLEVETHMLTSIDSRMKQLARPLPPSIKVTAGKRAAIVAIDNSIRIKHRNNLENIVLPKYLSFLRFRIN